MTSIDWSEFGSSSPAQAELVVVGRPVTGTAAEAADRFRPADALPTGSPHGTAQRQPPRHVLLERRGSRMIELVPVRVEPLAERDPVLGELGGDAGHRSQGFAGLTASRSTSSVPIGFPTWV